ncbi:hypothetical protein DF3PB_10072 [uncultured Defluviicoccus sp.]|uniref:Uncharacterized protein n=1 Tax=metagenome TaxID=256318 RepID=A0A380T833_9ZZZZ|nr:hypothetical protein DF3PB_10072 [uncultured Defluviicoccus sp.]
MAGRRKRVRMSRVSAPDELLACVLVGEGRFLAHGGHSRRGAYPPRTIVGVIHLERIPKEAAVSSDRQRQRLFGVVGTAPEGVCL